MFCYVVVLHIAFESASHVEWRPCQALRNAEDLTAEDHRLLLWTRKARTRSRWLREFLQDLASESLGPRYVYIKYTLPSRRGDDTTRETWLDPSRADVTQEEAISHTT